MHIFGAGIERVLVRASHACKIVISEIENKPRRTFSPKSLFESSIIVQLWNWVTSKTIGLDDPVVDNMKEFSAQISKQLALNIYQLLPLLSYLPTQFSRDIKRAQGIRNKIFLPEY